MANISFLSQTGSLTPEQLAALKNVHVAKKKNTKGVTKPAPIQTMDAAAMSTVQGIGGMEINYSSAPATPQSDSLFFDGMKAFQPAATVKNFNAGAAKIGVIDEGSKQNVP